MPHFLGLLRAANFGDGVGDFDGFRTHAVGDFNLDVHRAMLQHAPDHAVAFAGDESGGQRAERERLGRAIGHVQQAVRFTGIAEQRCGALVYEEFLLGLYRLQILFVGVAGGWLADRRRRRLHGMINFGHRVNGLSG